MYRNNNIQKRNSTIASRISFLVLFIIIFVVLFAVQLFLKSVIDHDSIVAMAEDQYIIEKELPYERGKIFLKDNEYAGGYYPVALNEDKFQVLVVPKNVEDHHETSKILAEMTGKEKDEIYEKINNDKLYVPPIAKGLDKERAEEVLNANLKGVTVMSEQARFYPENNLASQVMGFVDAENIGRYGLEGYYNEELTGKSGEVLAEKDILGRFISVGNQIDPEDGSDIYSTIDRNIQYISQKYLEDSISEMDAVDGAIIVVDPKNGGILSMASTPNFDPNKYYETAEDHPDYFVNPLVTDVWEPGSIMKPVVMGMAIDKGKVEPDTKEKFGQNVWVQGYEIRNARDEAFGNETMTQVLENSDNVAMVWVGNHLSNEEMREYFDKFGFGKLTDIDLEAEASGSLLEIGLWRDISRATMSFGQGISVTPLQMVMAYQIIANNGIPVKPHIVEKIVKPSGEVVEVGIEERERIISEDTANKVKDMLVSVIDNGHATSAQVKGYKVAGKTGTAQIPNDEGGYKEGEFVHSFCGFFPADDPQYVALVILDRPKKYKFAATTTAPLFGRLANWLLNYSQIQPK